MSEARTVDRYHLVRRVARGGMAEVYLALHRGASGFERRVALKKILPVYVGMEEFNSLFRDEAKISASLDHSGIVQVYDFGVHEREAYIVMEYVDGPDLEEVLDRCRRRGVLPPIEVVLYLAYRLASALEYAHGRCANGEPLGIIHRDVSPPNVLIGVQGEVKLADFGVAKAKLRDSSTRPGVLRGKYAYMSPEQVGHAPLDHRSDLFSLGTLLYETLTGVSPFEGSTDYRTMEAVKRAECELPSSLRPDTPIPLEAILMRCLEVSSDRRYQGASELRRALGPLVFEFSGAEEPECLVSFLRYIFPERTAQGEDSGSDEVNRRILPIWESLAHRLSPVLIDLPARLPGAAPGPIRLVPQARRTDKEPTHTAPGSSELEGEDVDDSDQPWSFVAQEIGSDGTASQVDLSHERLESTDPLASLSHPDDSQEADTVSLREPARLRAPESRPLRRSSSASLREVGPRARPDQSSIDSEWDTPDYDPDLIQTDPEARSLAEPKSIAEHLQGRARAPGSEPVPEADSSWDAFLPPEPESLPPQDPPGPLEPMDWEASGTPEESQGDGIGLGAVDGPREVTSSPAAQPLATEGLPFVDEWTVEPEQELPRSDPAGLSQPSSPGSPQLVASTRAPSMRSGQASRASTRGPELSSENELWRSLPETSFDDEEASSPLAMGGRLRPLAWIVAAVVGPLLILGLGQHLKSKKSAEATDTAAEAELQATETNEEPRPLRKDPLRPAGSPERSEGESEGEGEGAPPEAADP